MLGLGFIHAWMDHTVAAVQYRRVWRGFAPRG